MFLASKSWRGPTLTLQTSDNMECFCLCPNGIFAAQPKVTHTRKQKKTIHLRRKEQERKKGRKKQRRRRREKKRERERQRKEEREKGKLMKQTRSFIHCWWKCKWCSHLGKESSNSSKEKMELLPHWVRESERLHKNLLLAPFSCFLSC